MIYGRVIGNELRDVPPEYLPIWGQRWSGYRAPHGPSPFSTRIFSVDQMSEVGPALTSPTQFEATLTEEDEGEDDATSGPSRLNNSFPSSLTVQTDASNLTSWSERPTSQSVHRLWNHLHDNRASEPLLHSPTFHHGNLIEGGCLENDYTSWRVNHATARAGPSQGNLTEQLQHTFPSPSISDWQFANAHPQSPTYPFHTAGSNYLLSQFRANGQTRFISTSPPPSSCTFSLPQQIVGEESSRNHESNMPVTLDTAHPLHPSVVAEWPPMVPLDPSFSGPLQNSVSSLGLEMSYYMVSEFDANSSHADSRGTFGDAEDYTLSPQVDHPEGGQFS